MNRLINKKLICEVLRPLHSWVREGNVELRLKLIREMDCDPELDISAIDDEPSEDSQSLLNEMSCKVVDTLVRYSKGQAKGFCPYMKDASWSTKAFKSIPSTNFATTLAEIYPFLLKSINDWAHMQKKRAYPMTGLWRWGVMRRHMLFQQRFNENRSGMFKAYENAGGLYHGPEEEAPVNEGCDEDEVEDDEREGYNSEDADFV